MHVDGDGIDSIEAAIFSLHKVVKTCEPNCTHRHRKAQLVYVVRGLITIVAAGGLWTVPAGCALWIPSEVVHGGWIDGRVELCNVYVDADITTSSRLCSIVSVTPLLREIILRLASQSTSERCRDLRTYRLIAVLLDELPNASVQGLYLPMPSDKRLQRLTSTMLDDPTIRHTIEVWGSRVGASSRTLTRLFRQETGMSFVRWRQQLHVGLALQRLAQGELVTTVAVDLGYESVSAFIAMFKRIMGTTPTRVVEANGAPHNTDLIDNLSNQSP